MSKRSVTLPELGVLVIVTMAEVVVDVVPDIVTIADEEEWEGGGGGGGQELLEKSRVGGGWLVLFEPPPPFCSCRSPTKWSLGTPCQKENFMIKLLNSWTFANSQLFLLKRI